ncbi:MAG: hypothetical protein AAGD18_26135 [Actinomycetota bacterium]
MRFSTSGSIERLDLGPLLALVPPLLAEWAGLRFDDGHPVNPLSGLAEASVTLVEGRHRHEGARYRIVTERLAGEMPHHLNPEVDEQIAELRRRRGMRPIPMMTSAQRRQRAKELIGTVESTTEVVLVSDDRTGLRFVVTRVEDDQIYEVDIEIGLDGTPTMSAELRRAELSADAGRLERWLAAWLLPNDGAVRADPGPLLGEGGCALRGSVRTRRFRVAGRVFVARSGDVWLVRARGWVIPRGLALLFAPFLWVPARRAGQQAIERAWADLPSRWEQAAHDLRELATSLEELGPEAVVRQALWGGERS